MTNKWSYYWCGRPVKDANLVVLEIRMEGTTMADTFYLVEMLCCGSKKIVTHAFIAKRAREKRTLCSQCPKEKLTKEASMISADKRKLAKKKRCTRISANETTVAPGYHGWVPPKSALSVPIGWMPR